MIGFAFGIVLGAIAAAFVWLHMHQRAIEDSIAREVSDGWRDLPNLEERLVAKIEGKNDAK